MTFFLFQMTQKLLFKRGNLVGDDHPLPSVAEAWLSVACSIPSSIVLIADESGKHYFAQYEFQYLATYFLRFFIS